jgi:hypothetical protein
MASTAWQQIPALEGFSALCFEKGIFVAAAKEDGDYLEWNLYQRLHDASLESVNGIWATLDKTPQSGLDWAESIIEKL